MTESPQESASIPESPLMDDLPPVQPPSAGFILQLFVFPALIVMAVVAVWWMFGWIAAGEQDWRKLLQELQSQNLHIRNRSMYGLAQVLDQDSRRGDQGQNLRANREITQGLTDQLIIELRKNSSSKEGVAIQEYLTRALGMLDPLDITAPALQMAMEPQRDLDIRKSAVVSLSFIAGRALERQQPLSNPESIDALIQLSSDPLPILRQSSAFALGLFHSPAATHQLEVLLGDGDEKTRVNAAIGLARQKSTAGFAVIREALHQPVGEPAAQNASATGTTSEGDRLRLEGEQFLVVKNVLKAVKELAGKLDDSQRQELTPLLESLSSKHPEIRIRVDATDALQTMKRVSR
ncbi:HEAT repeat domain-containing protein [Schlesneria paludicola]|uniref:HEAT repeat domain-containing protein n=1 Tax=Schlesneria paludicola TaxID=360056 RepID=UPI00029B3A91|nr:HEAT repeat domain-containing protein [Schlesneria paludicola]